MAAPQVQSLEQIMSELNPLYNGQRQFIQGQQTAIPGQIQTQKAGLEAQRTNTFRDIRNTASRSGNTWSGIPLEEQARYVGEKFLPGMAAMEQSGNERMSLLEKALLDIDTQVGEKAFGEKTRQQTAMETFLEAERDRAWQAEQARIKREFDAAESAKSRASSKTPALPTLAKNKAGGWDVSGGYDLAGYARATGTDLITLLLQGDSQDRQAAQWYMDKIQKNGTQNASVYMQELARDRPTAFYRGG